MKRTTTTNKKANNKPKAKKVSISPFELEKSAHRNSIRGVFEKSGFKRIKNVEDKEFSFKGRSGDIDDVFMYENVIVLAEYTCTQSSKISDHLLKKKIIFDHILDDVEGFIQYFDATFETFKEARDKFFDISQFKLVILYASKYNISQVHKNQVDRIKYLDYPILYYFVNVTNAIRLSSKYEIFRFLSLNSSDIGRIGIQNREGKEAVPGTVLPESYSNFPKGYKVVTFYVAPEVLLRMSYVLRKEGWRTEGGLYQRMINLKKITQIRKYLFTTQRVFINNLIVTLPADTKLLDNNGDTVNPNSINRTQPVTIQITNNFDSIGLIDGQHRVYSYHEGGIYEEQISSLRDKQNLLVTGIIYPKEATSLDKTKFEASLFLEINSNQTNPKSDLKQDINLILRPYSTESIAKSVIHRINIDGPLEDKFEKYSYDVDKIKTTTVVSYGLVPIVKQNGNDCIFSIWQEEDKEKLKDEDDEDLLKRYIDFSTSVLNSFIGAIKKNIDADRWTSDKKVTSRVLSVTSINAFISCLRLIIEKDKKVDIEEIGEKLKGLNDFNFSLYKSSQYSKMGKDIYSKFFSQNEGKIEN